MTDEQREQIYKAWGVVCPVEIEAFGRTMTITAADTNMQFLDMLVDKYMPLCDRYEVIYRERGYTFFRDLIRYHRDHIYQVLEPMYKSIGKLLYEAGIMMSKAQLTEMYSDDNYCFSGIKYIADKFNDLVDDKNEAIDKYNKHLADYWHDSKDVVRAKSLKSNIWWTKNPEELYYDDRTLEVLIECLEITVSVIIKSGFAEAVNKYLGVPLFMIRYTKTDAVANGDVEAFRKPGDLEVLLKILEREPDFQPVYRILFLGYHVYKGCGIDRIINYAYQHESAANRYKLGLINEVLPDFEYYPGDKIQNFIDIFDNISKMWELDEEVFWPAYTFRVWIENIYRLEYVLYHHTLYRINGRAFDYNQTSDLCHRELEVKAVNAMNAILNTTCFSRIDFIRAGIKEIFLELQDLIIEDQLSIMGRKYDDRKTAVKIRNDIADIMEMYHTLDFSDPLSVMEIESAVLGHRHSDILEPLVERTKHAVELSSQIDAFLTEMESADYQNKQEETYDLMRGQLLNFEQLQYEMGRKDLEEWVANQFTMLKSAFGETFSSVSCANERYFAVLTNAWIYQGYLNEKNSGGGLLKKLKDVAGGFTNAKYEPDYLLATENGLRPLRRIAENEPENIKSYWAFLDTEQPRLKREYFERYDPSAIEAGAAMTGLIKKFDSLINPETLALLVESTVSYEI